MLFVYDLHVNNDQYLIVFHMCILVKTVFSHIGLLVFMS